jgi:hypothetical protein
LGKGSIIIHQFKKNGMEESIVYRRLTNNESISNSYSLFKRKAPVIDFINREKGKLSLEQN